ncbi:hypothetical protein LX59_03038 [Azomonas agilis]|uniref:Uncharacterized protein n=1 Tax=Azomonas agilis TaxID=116849 RepID=A0A562HZA2_9GAMM|nr:hypothetical protein LX59_03038 [Azomonas agilis]
MNSSAHKKSPVRETGPLGMGYSNKIGVIMTIHQQVAKHYQPLEGGTDACLSD